MLKIMEKAISGYRNDNIEYSKFFVMLMSPAELEEFKEIVDQIEIEKDEDREVRNKTKVV